MAMEKINEGMTSEQRSYIERSPDVKSGRVKPLDRYSPTPAGVHQDAALTTISLITGNPDAANVATQAIGTTLVDNESDVYPKYDSGAFRLADAPKRADATPYRRGGWNVEFVRYVLEEYGFETVSTMRQQMNASGSIDPRRKAAERASNTVRLTLAKQVADFLTTDGNYGTVHTPSTKWDATGGDAFDDIRDQATAIELKTGYRPNRLIVNPEVHDAIVKSAAYQNRVKNTTTNYGGTEADIRRFIAEACNIERYLVYNASYNTGGEFGTESYSWCMGKFAALIVGGDTVSTDDVVHSTTLLHRNYQIQIETYMEPQIDAEIFRAKGMWAVKGLEKEAGTLIKTPLT